MRIARSYSIEHSAGFNITDSEVIVEAAATGAIVFEEYVSSFRIESLVIFKDFLKTINQSLSLIFKGCVSTEPIIKTETIVRIFENINEVGFNMGSDRNLLIHFYFSFSYCLHIYYIKNLKKVN